MSFYKGEVVEFTYDGGSNPGEARVVLVLEDNNGRNIKAWDFAKEAVRTFNPNKISDYKFVDNFKSVPIESLPHGCVDNIVTEFINQGYFVYHGAEDIVALKPSTKTTKKNTNKLRGYNNLRKITFINNNHEYVSLKIEGDYSVTLNYNGSNIYGATVDDLVNAITSN
jgi:hypothetical protein